MSDVHNSLVPSPNAEHRRAAAGQFERANQVVATGNYDYGIRLLLSCCKLDPANLIYRQALRRTEKAKYRNNLRGSVFAWLTTWPGKARVRKALRAADYLMALERGEEVLTRNPWDVWTQMAMAEAADHLGLLDLAIWNLEQARHKSATDTDLNRSLARLYEKRGNFAQATALWDLIRKVKPDDAEAMRKVKDLAASETIARGNYAGALSGEKPAPGASSPPTGGKSGEVRSPVNKHPQADVEAAPAGADRVTRTASPILAKLDQDPTNPRLFLQLAGIYRQFDELEKARDVLVKGLAATGNAFEVALELADLDIEPFRLNLTLTEEKLKSAPDDPELRKIRTRLRKEINTRELEVCRQKAERYPTDLGHRFEVGLRLLRAGQTEEAVRELQAARGSPRHKWQALLYLGHAFKALNNWRLAQRNYEEALEGLPKSETEARKELLFSLAQGAAESGDLAKAMDIGNELANEDFGYRDIGKLLDQWQTRSV
jgi:tetratricopeptide (TPR) repeat protein